MKKSIVLIIGLTAFVLVVAFLVLLYTNSVLSNNLVGFYEYEAHVNIGDYVGFNLNSEKIYFGTVSPGGVSQREISINSNVQGFVEIRVVGDMEGMIYTTDYYNEISTDMPLSYKLYLNPSNNAKKGEYESKIYVYIFKSRNTFTEYFLPGSEFIYIEDYDKLPEPAKIHIRIAGPPNATNESKS